MQPRKCGRSYGPFPCRVWNRSARDITKKTSISDMGNEVTTVSRKRFFVFLVGKTNGAHLELVTKLKGFGQIEVNSPKESDYLLVFCPIVSRVGTDISEALDKLPGGKATILVVLHHTFNRDHVVAESRRLVNNMNVRLTVDCLFYEGRLLTCRRNDTAWSDIQKFLEFPPPR
ncbi:uncharacterized protein LOC127368644 isoform X2 [Dicentrarchus labrax]|uniref:uncharacterized protein LOC127368644 isoform X2 n=1 Tax=Dicentrarchus labrax TaxID=13489 RepID=UPI0021F59F07|nr:uncharacterized protein LOC127368644 isoform X2 [Dicentrarchus labrax]